MHHKDTQSDCMSVVDSAPHGQSDRPWWDRMSHLTDGGAAEGAAYYPGHWHMAAREKQRWLETDNLHDELTNQCQMSSEESKQGRWRI